MQSPPAGPSPVTVARLAGSGLLLCFIGLTAIRPGFFVGFHPPFTRVDQGEGQLWLSVALLLTPALLLLSGSALPVLHALFTRAHASVSSMAAAERKRAVLAATLLAVGVSRVLNVLVLGEYPITDDEWATRFGGELLASGVNGITLPFDVKAFPTLFLFVKGNTVSGMDWLGSLLPWAFAALTHTGNWVFAVLAAVPVACVAWVVATRVSPSWGVVAALVLFTSPMGLALSMTTHGHLGSRALLALLFALLVHAEAKPTLRLGLLAGVVLGLAAWTRLFEAAFLTVPFVVAESWRAVKEGGARRQFVLGALVTSVGLGALFLLHAHVVTDGWMPPRMSAGAVAAPQADVSWWKRFGGNTSVNVLRLVVWFGGPLGAGLCLVGALVDRFTRLLALSVVSVLALGAFHDNTGIHAVGPIHYSECVVPLALLATHGLVEVTRRVRALGLVAVRPHAVAATLLTALVVVNLTFFSIHAWAMRESARLQVELYEALEAAVPAQARPAVVLAPEFNAVWKRNAVYEKRGTWVFEWRRPRPDLSDDVLVLADGPGLEESVRRAFPERHFFRMAPVSDGRPFELQPLSR